MKKVISLIAVGITAISMLSIKDVVTNKDTKKMGDYHVYVAPHNIDIELVNGYGVLIGKEGIEIIPKYE